MQLHRAHADRRVIQEVADLARELVEASVLQGAGVRAGPADPGPPPFRVNGAVIRYHRPLPA